MNNLADFLQIGEVSTLLGVTRETLRNWDKTGKLVAVRHPLNGYRLYKKSDIDAILEMIKKELTFENDE